MSDAPEGPDDDARGGMQAGDPALAGATETGGQSIANRPTGGPDDTSDRSLPAEKGGSGGGGSGY